MSEYVPCYKCTNDNCPRGISDKSNQTYTFCDSYVAPKPANVSAADAPTKSNELQKAFALACRILNDNLPVRLPDNQSWQDYILERVRTEPVCRVCGCTEDNACPGGCYWVEPDLCSACVQAGEGKAE